MTECEVSIVGELETEVNASVPKTPIHIVIGRDEFTDEDIRRWADGDIDPDWPPRMRTFLIGCLSRIIVSKVLD